MSGIKICVDKEGTQTWLSPSELEKLTGVVFISSLEMESESIRRSLCRLGEKLEKKHRFASTWTGRFLGQFASAVSLLKRELRLQQIWRGQYYRQEISSGYLSDVVLRWINPYIGWGVFAARAFRPREYIAEYTGVVRRKSRDVRRNGYCFEYVSDPGRSTSFVIDAKERSGIARYINHNEESNIEPSLATIGPITHLIFLTKRTIKKGEQLSYDYGPDYWKKRSAPISLEVE